VDPDVIVITVVEGNAEWHQHQLCGDYCELNNCVANLFNVIDSIFEESSNSLLRSQHDTINLCSQVALRKGSHLPDLDL
jgi:hypothetical protein